jgi:hypothetical protein
VVKDTEGRRRHAIGAQHKLAGVDVAYALAVVEPFGRGREGLVKVKVAKDRPGYVRLRATDGRVAELRLRSHDHGRVTIDVEVPGDRHHLPPDGAHGANLARHRA